MNLDDAMQVFKDYPRKMFLIYYIPDQSMVVMPEEVGRERFVSLFGAEALGFFLSGDTIVKIVQ